MALGAVTYFDIFLLHVLASPESCRHLYFFCLFDRTSVMFVMYVCSSSHHITMEGKEVKWAEQTKMALYLRVTFSQLQLLLHWVE